MVRSAISEKITVKAHRGNVTCWKMKATLSPNCDMVADCTSHLLRKASALQPTTPPLLHNPRTPSRCSPPRITPSRSATLPLARYKTLQRCPELDPLSYARSPSGPGRLAQYNDSPSVLVQGVSPCRASLICCSSLRGSVSTDWPGRGIVSGSIRLGCCVEQRVRVWRRSRNVVVEVSRTVDTDGGHLDREMRCAVESTSAT